jgi:chitinase
VLANANGYPELRGMMTWSINWDALPNCGGTYEFANNYESIFKAK